MIGAGRFDQRVTVKRPVYTVNAAGERVEATPETIGARWAAITPLTGKEMDYAARVAAELIYTVKLRQPLDLRQTDRLVWGSRTLEVDSVFDVQGTGLLMVQCKELK